MLNLNNKILTKLISLILAQVFLFTGVVYPESTTNKSTSSIYIQAGDLRVPMGFSNRKSQADGAEQEVINLSERISRAYENIPGPLSEKTKFRRDNLISDDYLKDLKVPKGLLRQIGIEDSALRAQILVLPAEDIAILNGDPDTENIFKKNHDDKTKVIAGTLLPEDKGILDDMKSKLGIEGNFSFPLIVAAERIDETNVVHELTHVDKKNKGEIYKYSKNTKQFVSNSHEKEANLNSILMFRFMHPHKSFYDYFRMKNALDKENFTDEKIKKDYLENKMADNKPTPNIIKYFMWGAITKNLNGKENITEANVARIKKAVFEKFNWYDDLSISIWSKKSVQHHRRHPAKKVMDILELNENDTYLDLASGPGLYTFIALFFYKVKEAISLDISESNVMITSALLANFDNIKKMGGFGTGKLMREFLTKDSADVLFLLKNLNYWGAALGNIPNNATVIQGDARDMKQIQDNSITKLSVTELFDLLGGQESQKSCIKEILRVVRPGGKILLVYDFSSDADSFMEMFKKIAEENNIAIDVKKDEKGIIDEQRAFIIDIIDKNASPAHLSLQSPLVWQSL